MVEMALYFYSNIYLTVKFTINGIQGTKAPNALGIILQDRGRGECEPREDGECTGVAFSQWHNDALFWPAKL
jgi:hypothetical protein